VAACCGSCCSLLVLAVGRDGGLALAALLRRGCPSVEALRSYTPPQASRVFDREGQLLAHLAPERRIVVPLERIPSHVAGAFLAVEDKRFFEHRDRLPGWSAPRPRPPQVTCASTRGSAPSPCSSRATSSRST
jgi:membrane carboxypeptidase/penicillin-binding protein